MTYLTTNLTSTPWSIHSAVVCYLMKLYRLFIIFLGMACLILTSLVFAETCEGDKLAIPDSTILASIQVLAEAGDAHAQAQMGAAYLRGKGIVVDREKSLSWLEKSAAGGSSEGQYLLAKYYSFNGRSKEDFQKAAGLFQQSADQGCLASLFYLGALTVKGSVVPQNTDEGIRMITKAAEGGYVLAQVVLGSDLINGNGMGKDINAGIQWVKRAAESGDSLGEIALANRYLDGKVTPKNLEGARILYESVYAKNDELAPVAAYSLGRMYMEDKDVVDAAKAFRWMIVAAKANYSDSQQRLKTLIAQLPKQKLVTSCSVYMDSLFSTSGAKEYVHVKIGEAVAVLHAQGASAEVFFPDRQLLGYIPRQCMEAMVVSSVRHH